MPITPTTRDRLKAFEFTPLFIEDLGWDNCTQSFPVTVDSRPFRLTALAKKCGLIAYACVPADNSAHIPDRNTRLKIDREVTQTTYEHLLVFTDTTRNTQVWQWVRREPGKPIACREHTYHTAQPGDSLLQKLQQLAVSLAEEEKGLALPDITGRVRAAFDVERVTKRFYEQFRKEKDAFTDFIEGIPVAEDCHWYASVMLNRLMFVYFMQRKGFLDSNPNYLRDRLQQMRRDRGKDQFYTFYRHFLLRLFQEGLGQRPPRKAGLDKLLGRIPYLNGGIFDVHTLETEARYGPQIQIPDEAFERIFSYFDQWAWHLDERPLHADNEINPAVLGFIFEKYINQKEMGAYYTQEDITEYIGKSTIIPFLFDAARARCKVAFENPNGPTVWTLLQANPDRYIYPAVRHGMGKSLPPEIAAGLDPAAPGLASRRKAWNKPAPPEYALPAETWREVVARRQHCERVRARLASGQVEDINELVTLNLDVRQFAQDTIENCEGPDLLMAFWQAITGITVLDPTGGSGAFTFAALNVLEPLYEACLERMEAFLAEWGEQGRKLHPNYHKKFTEILARVAHHPNRRYFVLKSIVINNLYAVDIMEEAIEICKLRLFLKLAAQVEPDPDKPNLGIEPLPDIDFNIRAGNTLVGYATADEVRRCMTAETTSGTDQMKLQVLDEKDAYAKFEDRLKIADAAFRKFREQQTEIGGTVTTEDKAELRAKLKNLEDELNRYLAHDYGLKVADKTAMPRWLKSHRPFHWLIEFYGIISNGGFDVIIGNPPYIEIKALEGYQVRGYKCEGAGNLYALVIERSASLGRRNGRQGFIVPVSSISTERYMPLQELLLTREDHFSSYDDRPSRLFDGLEHIRLTIHILGREARSKHHFSTRYHKWSSEERPALFAKLCFASSQAALVLVQGTLPKLCSPLELSIIVKIAAQHHRLSSFYSKTTRHRIFYSRKVGYFLQVLDFQPRVLDGDGQKRPPSEFKELIFATAEYAKIALCCLNSSLFYWFTTVFSDCRHVNKREVDALPVNLEAIHTGPSGEELRTLANILMADLQKNSVNRTMTFKHDTLTVECIYPKASKPILDQIDTALARHYGLTSEELDFILNYDIKYRLGRDSDEEEKG